MSCNVGYVTVAYGVDIEKLGAVKGSCDERLLSEMESLVAEKERRAAEWPSSSVEPLSLRGALERVINDRIEPVPNGDHQYVYAMELLCRHLGTSLDGHGHITFLEDLEWDIAASSFRTPLGLPQPGALPDTCYLTVEQVKGEYERFRDVDPDDDERPYLAEAREEYVWWLKQCADESLGLVTFCY